MYDPTTYHKLKVGTIIALCFLEKVFAPSFFDLMMHLVIHLIDELDVCGLIHAWWMYPIERAMKDLKGYVQNMCRPEGNMVKAYIFYEALGFNTKYMQNFGATKRCIWDANEEERVVREVLERQPKWCTLTL